ncbi:MAG: hypothetical protein CL862_11195 [Cyanobium sp. NAT70]|nr:hypothetical protein [Cyanobium sp. NAT70]
MQVALPGPQIRRFALLVVLAGISLLSVLARPTALITFALLAFAVGITTQRDNSPGTSWGKRDE